MATKTGSTLAVVDNMSKYQSESSAPGQLEAQSDLATANSHGRLKRDLGSRHINMIAIAGMIVFIPS